MASFYIMMKWAVAALIAVGLAGPLAAETLLPLAPMDAKGRYLQPWFEEASGDLARDQAAAKRAGKLLAVLWEQENCHYCRMMHEVNLRQPDIAGYIAEHFHVVVLDMRGGDDVVGFDGATVSQADLAKQMRVFGTPTVLFYGGGNNVTARLPGYARPKAFKKVFEYVVEEGYRDASMIDWIRARLKKEAEG